MAVSGCFLRAILLPGSLVDTPMKFFPDCRFSSKTSLLKVISAAQLHEKCQHVSVSLMIRVVGKTTIF
jgi:hypothetical protein